jgi:hypothetical protein
MNLYDNVPSLSEVIAPSLLAMPPWKLAADVEALVAKEVSRLEAKEYYQHGNVWIHHLYPYNNSV